MAGGPENTNIQKLLAAEKTAQDIVDKARKKRADKMKLAKQEAEREIAAYRAEREAEYQNKMTQGTSMSDSTFAELDKETAAAIQAITNGLPAKKKEAVDMLVKFVEDVQLES